MSESNTAEPTEEQALRVARAIWVYCQWFWPADRSGKQPEWSDEPEWMLREAAVDIGRTAIKAMS